MNPRANRRPRCWTRSFAFPKLPPITNTNQGDTPVAREDIERRLAAILSADVVGYTRLMGTDEAGTLQRFTELRKNVLGPLIAKHRGRVVKLLGDGLLVEYASVVDAVGCAVAWQSAVAQHEAQRDEASRLTFRIGIHLGDVIVEGDDIHGDSVNVASRLESLAEPGGIYLSGDAYRQVRGKIEAEFEDLGERELKNVAEPVQVYRIGTKISGAVSAKPAGVPLPLPEKPSIAVLPFTNMSGDPEQEYFADGLVEEIITALSKISKLFVVARNSTFIYKGQAVDVKRVGREQGVRYVLEGSLRKAGNRLRVTAQLIDAASGHHLWAERYDREASDVFAVQDEIAREVVSALQIQLTEGEQARLWASGTQNFEAWELSFRAAELIDHHVREDTEKGRKLLERALKIDPDYAYAWCKMGEAHWSDGRHHWSHTVAESYAKAREAANRAHQLDPEDAEPFALLAMIAFQEGSYDEAERFAGEVVDRAVGQSYVLALSAMVLGHCGRPAEAIGLVEQAMRLCPIYPNWYRVVLGRAYYLTGDLDRAIETLRIWYENDPNTVEPVLLAAALFDSGRRAEARDICQGILKAKPGFTIGEWQTDQSYKDGKILAHLVDVLETSGVPH